MHYFNKSVKGAPMETLVACASATEAREIAKRLRRSDSSRQVRYSCSRRAAKAWSLTHGTVAKQSKRAPRSSRQKPDSPLSETADDLQQ
jgi:hypothetical protein